MASLFSPCSHCTECPELVITDTGEMIKETADIVRLRSLMSETRVAPRSQSPLRLERLAKLFAASTSCVVSAFVKSAARRISSILKSPQKSALNARRDHHGKHRRGKSIPEVPRST